MSARMQYPLSQRRHTNIAVIRYSKHGVKLEIACYKNKVISYRAGTEDRLDEVLQVDRVFTNVSKGLVAPDKDIKKVFGEDATEQEAIKFMLEHGDLQVAQHERVAEVDEIFKDICLIISQKCINLKTQRPFPVPVIEQALKSIGVSAKIDQPPKKQALQFIHQLVEEQIIPIARAPMRVRVIAPLSSTTEAVVVALLEEWCTAQEAVIEERKEITGEKPSLTFLVTMQPNLFKEIDGFVKKQLPEGSTVHVVEAAVHEEGEVDLLHLMEKKNPSSDDDDNEDDSAPPPSGKTPKKVESYGHRSTEGGSSAPQREDDEPQKGKKGKKKRGKKGKRGNDSSSDDEDDEVPVPNRRKKGGLDNDLAAELEKLNLVPGAAVDDSDDSEDDGKARKKGNRRNRKKNNKAHVDPQEDNKSEKEGSDSDEDLAGGNRKKRKGKK